MTRTGVRHIKNNQPNDIEIEALKNRVDSLEIQMKSVWHEWTGWTSSTKNMGQKIMIALEQIVKDKNEP